MKVLIIILIIVTVTACSDPLIHYSYKGVTITRVSESGHSKFYYGNFGKKGIDTITSYINVEYFGFNNGMDLLIVFKKNDVEFIDYGGGWITEVGKKNPHVYHSRYGNDILDLVVDKYKKDSLGMIRISDVMEIEKKHSAYIHSQVQVDY